MKNLILMAKIDIKESLRSRWFLIYILTFAGLISVFFLSGVTDSRVAGFAGLTRLLLLFIQICLIILPIFILITTVRSISYDRDMNTLEYLLSYPISLYEYYFGKALGRGMITVLPLLLSFIVVSIVGAIKAIEIPWGLMTLYAMLLSTLGFVFLAFGFLISSVVKTQEMSLALAFFVWLFFLAFLDLGLIGLMMKSGINESVIYSVALLNPIQTFRVASMSLFDPNLTVIGAAAYYILDEFGRVFFIIYSLIYPLILGVFALYIGFISFKKKDLV